MTLLEQLINNAGEPIVASKDVNGNFIVHIDRCGIYNGIGEIGACGRGTTLEQATEDYINQISGKELVFNYGTDSERKMKCICFIRG